MTRAQEKCIAIKYSYARRKNRVYAVVIKRAQISQNVQTSDLDRDLLIQKKCINAKDKTTN